MQNRFAQKRFRKRSEVQTKSVRFADAANGKAWMFTANATLFTSLRISWLRQECSEWNLVKWFDSNLRTVLAASTSYMLSEQCSVNIAKQCLAKKLANAFLQKAFLANNSQCQLTDFDDIKQSLQTLYAPWKNCTCSSLKSWKVFPKLKANKKKNLLRRSDEDALSILFTTTIGDR